ncbi:hypothetical protein BSZ32_02070 [Rubritalea profundi]|uniref:Uncharacterized protein n=1 Tax=Rubritalea profundi TaxID=1658618 RepID=A0A2S7TYV9_9BACT|nr:hypothetical protein BSZ32_02070 [Rubritalea profundi]
MLAIDFTIRIAIVFEFSDDFCHPFRFIEDASFRLTGGDFSGNFFVESSELGFNLDLLDCG